MIKKIITMAFCFLSLWVAAQEMGPTAKPEERAFYTKGHHVTAGYGYPNLFKTIIQTQLGGLSSISTGYGNSLIYDVTGIGPAFVKYDYGIDKELGIGLNFGYSTVGITETYTYQDQIYNSTTGTYSTVTYADIEELKIKSFTAALRFNYHFGNHPKLDPYLGLAAGYTNTKWTYTAYSTNPSVTPSNNFSFSGIPVHFSFSFGLRYYITEGIGLYTEIGFEKWSVIQGGLAIKFH
jgi:opacity protein-like surface antigen